MGVELRNSEHDHAFIARAGFHHLAIFAALQNALKAGQFETAFRPLLAVAPDAGGLH
jgi:hypothetical protein